MGGKSRLRVHGVSKIFPIDKNISATATVAVPDSMTSYGEIHKGLFGLQCESSDSRPKDSTGKEGCSDRCCSKCGANTLSEIEIWRIVRYLNVMRININVRQVFPTII